MVATAAVSFFAQQERARRASTMLIVPYALSVAADEDIKLMEHELLHAVACVLDCPMPSAIAALDPRLLRK